MEDSLKIHFYVSMVKIFTELFHPLDAHFDQTTKLFVKYLARTTVYSDRSSIYEIIVYLLSVMFIIS